MEAKPRDQPPADVDLVAAMVRGDSGALGTLFDRHHQNVYRFLARLSGTDSGDLDDLVQNTFVRLVDAAPRFARQASVRSWILAIAGHVARDHIRAEIRRRRNVRTADLPPPVGPARPDQGVEGREALARFRQAMDGLSHELRVAYIMCDLEDTSGKDAASALGIPEGTLWRRLHDARKTLLRAMSESPAAVKEAIK